jgi:uncharacterized protein Veg
MVDGPSVLLRGFEGRQRQMRRDVRLSRTYVSPRRSVWTVSMQEHVPHG